MAQEPPWDPGGPGTVPVSPEPQPAGGSGAGGAGAGGDGAGGASGPGGWGGEPRTEPLAIAAMVWAVVSLIVVIVGTVVAFVLAGRASEAIRRSGGTRKGDELVTAARFTAGGIVVLQAVFLVLFFALRGGDHTSNNAVVTPTQPSVSTTLPPSTTVTTAAPTTAVTTSPTTTTRVAPTTSIVPPPSTAPTTLAPTTTPPTRPPTTTPPTTTPPTTTPPTTTPPTTTPPTTTPAQHEEAILEKRMLDRPQLGPSNRGVPNAERFVVAYTPGRPLVVTWAINDGAPPLPTGPAGCAAPPTTTTTTHGSSPTTTSTSTSTTTTTTTSTTTTVPASTTTPPPRNTKAEARYEARQILVVIRGRLRSLDITNVELEGTYPMSPGSDGTVVQVAYSVATVRNPNFDPARAFEVPPAQSLDCINPAFE